MVKISSYTEKENSEGKKFYVLALQGGVEFVKSKETGKHYATARTCTMSTTFDEEMCKSLIGQKFPGSIVKVECDPYEFVIPQTGEEIVLSHRWDYSPDSPSMEETIFEKELVG